MKNHFVETLLLKPLLTYLLTYFFIEDQFMFIYMIKNLLNLRLRDIFNN